MWLVLSDEIMVHGTYHPSLTGGSFIIDKTYIQYAWLIYFKLYNFIPEDHIRNSNKHKPMASNRYKIEVQQYIKIENWKLCSSDFRCGFSWGFIQGFGLWSWRTFHPEKSLEQTMVNKYNTQCCLFLQAKHCTKLI